MVVPDGGVAAHTGDLTLAMRHDVMGDGLMAAFAGAFGHATVVALDLDVVGIIAGGEVKRVEETVGGFHGVLAEEVVRRVAIVTGGDGAVTRFHPAVVIIAHDVAVRARAGIVREIGVSLRVDEGVRADADHDPDQYAEQ